MKNLRMLLIFYILLIGLVGCGENASVTEWGGTKEIYLPEGMKFVNYNIQDTELIWCTYRPMRVDEFPETYIIQQDKTGINISGNGKFIIYETKDSVRSTLPEIKYIKEE